MERIDIYTSRKKSFKMLLLLLPFIAGSIWMLLGDFDKWPPLAVKVTGFMGIMFSGFGFYVAIRRLIKNRLFLIIDSRGICVDPQYSTLERVEWGHIVALQDFRAKTIVIHVDNPHYWIDSEKNALRRSILRFNMSLCGSPFSISASATHLSHDELLMILKGYLIEFTKK